MFPLNWFQVGGGALAAFALSWLLHTVDVGRIEAGQKKALTDQQTVLEKHCADDKQLTEENSRAYKNNMDILADRLIALKRVQPARCVMPVAGETGGGPSSPFTDEHARPDGVSTDALLDYGADCERLRLQVISLQSFINDTWARGGAVK